MTLTGRSWCWWCCPEPCKVFVIIHCGQHVLPLILFCCSLLAQGTQRLFGLLHTSVTILHDTLIVNLVSLQQKIKKEFHPPLRSDIVSITYDDGRITVLGFTLSSESHDQVWIALFPVAGQFKPHPPIQLHFSFTCVFTCFYLSHSQYAAAA